MKRQEEIQMLKFGCDLIEPGESLYVLLLVSQWLFSIWIYHTIEYDGG